MHNIIVAEDNEILNTVRFNNAQSLQMQSNLDKLTLTDKVNLAYVL